MLYYKMTEMYIKLAYIAKKILYSLLGVEDSNQILVRVSPHGQYVWTLQ